MLNINEIEPFTHNTKEKQFNCDFILQIESDPLHSNGRSYLHLLYLFLSQQSAAAFFSIIQLGNQ